MTSTHTKAAAGSNPVQAAAFQLTPMQHWFFGQELNDAHHWNQAYLFHVNERLYPDALRAALTAVVEHHPALRLRFARMGHVWEQKFHTGREEDILTVHDLSTHADLKLKREIERACKVTQARLNFEFGPVIRAAYLDCGEDRPGRLMLAIHHLCVDNASWHILLEDLETAYRQEVAHKPVVLPVVPVNYARYAAAVSDWTATPAAQAELPLWQAIQRRVAATPEASVGSQDHGADSEGNAFTVHHIMSVEETSRLENGAREAWMTSPQTLIVAALSTVLTARSGMPVCSFMMEGNARTMHTSGLDTSRTIGWCSCLHPVFVNVPPAGDATALVAAAQEALQQTPGDGSGFGALCCSEHGLALSNTEPSVLFRYAGGDGCITGETSLFSIAPESTGSSRGPAADRKYGLEITALVKAGALVISITGGSYVHESADVQAMADDIGCVLRQLAGLA